MINFFNGRKEKYENFICYLYLQNIRINSAPCDAWRGITRSSYSRRRKNTWQITLSAFITRTLPFSITDQCHKILWGSSSITGYITFIFIDIDNSILPSIFSAHRFGIVSISVVLYTYSWLMVSSDVIFETNNKKQWAVIVDFKSKESSRPKMDGNG